MSYKDVLLNEFKPCQIPENDEDERELISKLPSADIDHIWIAFCDGYLLMNVEDVMNRLHNEMQ